MKPAFKLDSDHRRLRYASVLFCTALVGGCQTETFVLSPAMHARIVDGMTGRPLDRVRVMLVSPDAATEIAYSDRFGFVDMPGLVGQDSTVFRITANSPRAAVHAVFERPGYEPYTIDAVNGYGFFKGYRDVHLYPE